MSATKLNNLLNIPVSGLTFAAGASLIGEAVAGPVGAVVGAVGGAVVGAITEVQSQKQHRADSTPVSSKTDA